MTEAKKRDKIGFATWEYFDIKKEDATISICNLCQVEVQRGKIGSFSKDFNTKGMWKHLESFDKDDHSTAANNLLYIKLEGHRGYIYGTMC